ncbi:MAG: polysaccharide biosynthesis protein [Flavobacteriia bacterium]|nr:polysaccharide biosynthesis protein [Flavobacteriia bacterium]
MYGLPSIIGRLLNFLLVPLYTEVFAEPSHYGVVSELYAYVAFLVVVLTFGMETSYFRFLQVKEDKNLVFQNSFLTVIGVNIIFFLLLVTFNQRISNALLFGDHIEYIVLLGAIVCIDSISALPLAKLRAEENAKKFAFIQFASIGVNIGLNLFLMLIVFNPLRPEEGVLFILFANLFASLVKPLFLYKDFLKIQFQFEPQLAKEMIVYAFPLMIGGFAGIINETLDRILLKHITYNEGISNALSVSAAKLKAEAEVGIYSACYKLSMLVTILIQAYRYAAEPFFFAQSKNEDKNKIYSKVMNYFVAVVCFVFLLVSLNIDFFKHFIRNESYWVGLNVVPILLLANVFVGVYFNQSIWYKLSGQTKFGAYIAIAGASLTILLNVIFIPTYGYMASAWATFIVYAFQMVVSYILGQKYYPIKYNLRKFWLYLGVAILFYFLTVMLNFQDQSLGKFFVHNMFILLYVALIWFLEKPAKAIR